MSTQLTVAERQILRNELPIEILRLEDVNKDDGDVLRLHPAKHFEFVWLKEGGGDLVIDLSAIALQRDKMYCISPGKLRKFWFDESARGYVIIFRLQRADGWSDEFEALCLAELFDLLSKSNGMDVRQDIAQGMDLVIQQMRSEFRTGHPWRTSIVSRYASILFIYLARHFSEPLRCSLGKGNVRLVSDS